MSRGASLLPALVLKMLPTHQKAMSIVIIIVTVLAWLALVYMKAGDPYGLFHLSLNILPGGSETDEPKTEWLNMGYWKVSVMVSLLD